MPGQVGVRAWNWNAPTWLGINTINVDGRTTTLFGSFIWGLPVVEAIRDHAERALREVMESGRAGAERIPEYSAAREKAA